LILIDVNVLIYAHREDAPGHRSYAEWLERTVATEPAFGISDLVLSAVVRIVTHPRAFNTPTSLDSALGFVSELRVQPNCVLLSPGPGHWEIFVRLCRTADAKGPLVTDAYLAALAIESGSEWITTDRDFARFPGLRWRHPLA
jgi:toxin-antitoxin system PIN domain toxin